jgi:CheY-like chemotaxis protein
MERKRILIAANQRPEIQELRKALVTAGYEVKTFDNGADALASSREFKPHLVVSELNLQKVDGHHLLRELKSQSSTDNIPFILITPHRTVAERVHSINLGVDDYITTPFDIQEVVLRLEIIIKELETYEATVKKNRKGFSGKLADLNLVELLQTLAIGKKSALIKVQNENNDGMIFLRDGQLIGASLLDLSPKDALFRMFSWNEGGFRVELRITEQDSEFDEKTEDLLAQGLTYRDNWNKISRKLPPLHALVIRHDTKTDVTLSSVEAKLLKQVNGSSRLISIVEESEFNDLQALKAAANLFSYGAIIEVTTGTENEQPAEKSSKASDPFQDTGKLSSLVTNFLKAHTHPASSPRVERRRNERRSGDDRRVRPRRWRDFVGEKNRIYLNKSELLMIRDKLRNGK